MKSFAQIFIVLFLLMGSSVCAQESKYQALYLYNFTKYIDWSGEQITIGVIGNSPVLIELESLTRNNGKITLLKIAGSESVNSCDMIFLPESQSRNFDLIQDEIGSGPVILVTENEELITKGAEMAFYTKNSKLKFIVNKQALDETGIKMSMTLLGQARVVD